MRVTLLEHNSPQYGGSATWNVLNRNDQVVGSGVYFYHVESGGARRVGRFTVVNFAQEACSPVDRAGPEAHRVGTP